MLQDRAVPRGERRGGKAKHLPERKIPRHDGEHDPERLEADVAALRVALARLVGQEGGRVLGVVLARPAALLRLRPSLGERLSHLQGHGTSVGVGALAQQPRGGMQPGGALCDRAPPPLARRGIRPREHAVELVRVCLLERLEQLTGRGIH